MNNMDINKLLAAISKMDKEELEKNIYKAQTILENSNLNSNFKNKNKDENWYEWRFFWDFRQVYRYFKR